MNIQSQKNYFIKTFGLHTVNFNKNSCSMIIFIILVVTGYML